MKSEKVVRTSLSKLFYNPGHIHHILNCRFTDTKRPITIPAILKKIKMGRSNAPVVIQSSTSAENHLNHLQHLDHLKSASSLAAQPKINGDNSHQNTSTASTSSTSPLSSIIIKDKAAVMGNPFPLFIIMILSDIRI